MSLGWFESKKRMSWDRQLIPVNNYKLIPWKIKLGGSNPKILLLQNQCFITQWELDDFVFAPEAWEVEEPEIYVLCKCNASKMLLHGMEHKIKCVIHLDWLPSLNACFCLFLHLFYQFFFFSFELIGWIMDDWVTT